MKRIKSLDLARGFTVLMIAPIHTVMLYSRLAVHETLLSKLLAFIAEWHGAQVFMLLMGISFSFSKRHTLGSVLQRASILLAAAYALNIFKFVVPGLLGWLPGSLLTDLQIQNAHTAFLQLFLIGDILHFAAFALLILFFVYQFPRYRYWSLFIVVIICFASTYFWDADSNNVVVNYFLQLASGQPPHVFFPLFPWLAYPLTGLTIGYYFQQIGHQKVFWLLRDTGWLFIIISAIVKWFSNSHELSSFYRTTTLDTILHAGVVLVALSCWEWISINVKHNHFFTLLVYLSEHITLVYIIQWVVIFWLLPLFGYHQLGFVASIFCILLTSLLTLSISLFINSKMKKTPKN